MEGVSDSVIKDEVLARIATGPYIFRGLESERDCYEAEAQGLGRKKVQRTLAGIKYEGERAGISDGNTDFSNALVSHLYDFPLSEFPDQMRVFHLNYGRYKRIENMALF